MRDETLADVYASSVTGVQYDAGMKNLMSNKEIIVSLLQMAVPEFRGCSQEEIVQCLDFSSITKDDFVSDIPDIKSNPRACLKNHSRNLHAPLCGIFHPNSVAVARYGALIRAKSPTNCDAHLTESLFQTRSRISRDDSELSSLTEKTVRFDVRFRVRNPKPELFMSL